MGKSSKSGKVDFIHEATNAVYLYDFDVNSAELKTKHKAALDIFGAGFWSYEFTGAPKYYVMTAQGFASRTGTEASNLLLSQRRANAASDYLSSKIPKGVPRIPMAWGESLADGDVDESEMERAVLVMRPEYDAATPPPPKVRVPPFVKRHLMLQTTHRAPPKIRTFRIRYMEGGGFGTPWLSLGLAKIRIVDPGRTEYADFRMITGSVAKGFSLPGSIEYAKAGKFAEFSAPADMTLDDFEGGAQMFAAGAEITSESLGSANRVVLLRWLGGELHTVAFSLPSGDTQVALKIGAEASFTYMRLHMSQKKSYTPIE